MDPGSNPCSAEEEAPPASDTAGPSTPAGPRKHRTGLGARVRRARTVPQHGYPETPALPQDDPWQDSKLHRQAGPKTRPPAPLSPNPEPAKDSLPVAPPIVGGPQPSAAQSLTKSG